MLRMLRATIWLALALPAGCLSSPSPADSQDAAASDAGRTAADAATDAAADAAPVGGGAEFPPAGMAVSITGGWAGDLNGDGVDDVVLLSDTGDPASAGLYVLMGQRDLGLPDYHQFLATGSQDPLAVAATQLDGGGGLDLVAFAVDYGELGMYEDNESYLHAYLADGTSFADALTNRITKSRQNHLFPRTEGAPAGVVPFRLRAAYSAPALAVFHERGSFVLALDSWDVDGWKTQAPLALQASYAATGGAAFASAATGVDDLIAFTDSMPQMDWLVNDGAGNVTARTVEGVAPGVTVGALHEMTGAAPADVVGAGNSCLQATPVDDDAGSSGVTACVSNVGRIRGLVVFDGDDPANGTPEIVAVADACDAVGGADCWYLFPDAYIDESASSLAGGTATHRAMPSSFAPRFVARGDFDGDGADELRAFGAGGKQDCVRLVGGALTVCP
jgi:hypothetical protein